MPTCRAWTGYSTPSTAHWLTESVKLPDAGEGIVEAEILTWHVAPGDTVAVGQPVCGEMESEVPTDTAAAPERSRRLTTWG